MIHYNKLIRDKVPDIKAQQKEKITFHVAEEKEYWHKLLEKLQEEINEFGEKGDMESFGDILEVLEAMRDFKQFDHEEVMAIKKNKKIELGGFEKRMVLEESEKEVGHRQEQTI
jgi:predicted house-cleaning noncanonical NTP pyrophosphatase (MazG superfamily)